MNKSIITSLTYTLFLTTLSVETWCNPAVPQSFIDRLESLQLYPGHHIFENRSDGERLILVTLPKGEFTDTWTSRLIISVEPPFEPIPQEGLQGYLPPSSVLMRSLAPSKTVFTKWRA